jgi:hypothetical protein
MKFLVLLLRMNPIESIVAMWKEVPTLPVLNNVEEPTYMFAATISAVRIGALLLSLSSVLVQFFFLHYQFLVLAHIVTLINCYSFSILMTWPC